PASFSSYGTNLDILAPGENMTTATWTKSNSTSAYVSGIAGTSFAAPYVSGLLSLARSHHPDASWAELTHALRATADHASLTAAQPVSATLGSGYAQADDFITRIITPSNSGMRYQFGPLVSAGTLGSTRAHQCRESGDFPATWLYEITTGSNNYYTLDTLAYVRAQTRGDTVKKLWYSCVGLPGDQPSTLRTINLFSEIKNNPAYKPAL
ncbi:MAG TPA: S8 family serine peptidase, partial [Candidatus Saccharimonadales bacterium]|nr:S8 family serine peptidase [Candidatus Saccharimonadales bacterium]